MNVYVLQPALQNLLQRVVRFFHPRSSCTMTHISADVQRIILNASCMTISGGRTKQLDIFCRITGFTSDYLSFIVEELIRFFHGALQLHYKDDMELFVWGHLCIHLSWVHLTLARLVSNPTTAKSKSLIAVCTSSRKVNTMKMESEQASPCVNSTVNIK